MSPFALVLYFSGNANFNPDSFRVSLNSLLQNELFGSIWVTGNKNQINNAKAFVEDDSFVQKRFQPSWVVDKSELNGSRLNSALSTIKAERIKGGLNSKVIFLRVGDYLHPNFLNEASNAILSLDLSRDPISKYFIMGTTLHSDGKSKTHTTEETLKIHQDQIDFWGIILNPKYLSLTIPFLWDLDLILEYDLQFDSDLTDFNLQFAKFNLDNLLLSAKLNNYVVPEVSYQHNIIYIARELMVEPFYHLDSEEVPTWREILLTKSEILSKIAGWHWWWRQIQIKLINL